MAASTFDHGKNHYGPVMLNPSTLAQVCTSAQTWAEIMEFHHLLASDEYVQYVDSFYRESIKRYGDRWWYFDIVNALYGASKCVQPANYLEVGVRRGRSVCTVARACPTTNIVAFDMWMANYAGMENPGPDFVKNELRKHGHKGSVTFINGNSHETLPAFFKQYPQLTFDMITIDGDHTEEGAWQDLIDTVDHLSVGGVLVFDDISHPAHPYLLDVWVRLKQRCPWLATYEFGEVGYGVAFGIRRAA